MLPHTNGVGIAPRVVGSVTGREQEDFAAGNGGSRFPRRSPRFAARSRCLARTEGRRVFVLTFATWLTPPASRLRSQVARKFQRLPKVRPWPCDQRATTCFTLPP